MDILNTQLFTVPLRREHVYLFIYSSTQELFSSVYVRQNIP